MRPFALCRLTSRAARAHTSATSVVVSAARGSSSTGPTVVTNAWSAAALPSQRLGPAAQSAVASAPLEFQASAAVPEERQSDPLAEAPVTLTSETVLSLVELFVPTVSTSVTQIARRVPVNVMQALSELPEGNAGLAGYLTCHPALFAVTRIGKVIVARRLRGTTSISPGKGKELLRGRGSGAGPPSIPRPAADKIVPGLQEAMAVVPPFLIPVSALLEGEMPPAEVHAFLRANNKVLRYVNPFSNSALPADDAAGTWQYGYVSLHPLYQQVAALAGHAPPEDGAASAETAVERFAAHEVQDYEWYRVARLLPFTNTEVTLEAGVKMQASLLLPSERSLLHVMYSAPHLFHVRTARVADEPLPRQQRPGEEPPGETDADVVGSAAHSDAGDSGVGYDEMALGVRCRYILDPAYAMTVKESKDELLDLLERIHYEPMPDGSIGRKPKQHVDRHRRRNCRRRLQYLDCVTPFFDERVLALQLLDLLPADGPVAVSALIAALPEEARSCLPGNMRFLFMKFPDYFVCFRTDAAEAFVQRADLPLPPVRALESIEPEEILQEIFNKYPLRYHPDSGTCMAHCMQSLPFMFRKRVRLIRDVKEEVLGPFPDKVELLPEATAMRGALQDKEKLAAFLLGEWGRRDMLAPFRFTGEWRERLVTRYEKHCAKQGLCPDCFL